MVENKVTEINSKVAILGCRGIPNYYGGFEAFAENLSVELVKRNFRVLVSCEKLDDKINPKEYKGVELFYFPFKPPESSFLRMIYEFLYDGYSLLWASRKSDYIYMLGYSAAVFFFIPKIFGKKLLVNPGGMEWKRDKFNRLIKSLLKFSERVMTIWADTIIADSQTIKEYMDKKYGVDTVFIPYGIEEPPVIPWEPENLSTNLEGSLSEGGYWLVIARLEPENNIHTILEAYLKSTSKKPLLIVGNYSSLSYEKFIKNILNNKPTDKTVLLPGGVYDQRLLEMLRQNCFVYIHGHSVGGTNPSLLESMIMKNMIIAHDNRFNREVTADSAIYFKDVHELRNKMEKIEKNNQNYFGLKELAYKRVKNRYNWDEVYDSYQSLFVKND